MFKDIILTDKLSRKFWKHVDIRGENDCWEWTGAKYANGYGVISGFVASRIAMVIATGKQIPHGQLVCHYCDNPSCVNPSHLFIGSYTDNTCDMYNKNRHPRKGVSINPIDKSFRLNLETVAHLSIIATHLGISKSETVRYLIGQEYDRITHPRQLTDVDEHPVYQSEPTVELEVERRR
jgi:hypothetical protein